MKFRKLKLGLLLSGLLITITGCGDENKFYVDSIYDVSTISTPTPISNGFVSQGIPSYDTFSYQPNSSVIEGNWEYFIQPGCTASRDFMRTPYIANVTSTAPSNYYESTTGKTGQALLTVLKNISQPNGIKRSYDWSRYETVDEDPNNSSHVFNIYNRMSYGKSAHVSGNAADKWNKEHTYPQSKISSAAAKDSILIFADDWKTNGVRSNNKFGEVAHNTSTAVKDSAGRVTACYSASSTFEPCDAAKGEVARSTLYTFVAYGHNISGNFTSLALCLKWHKQFPPTTWEMLRNNRNYSVQKNRNPFIDHPEFADLLEGVLK